MYTFLVRHKNVFYTDEHQYLLTCYNLCFRVKITLTFNHIYAHRFQNRQEVVILHRICSHKLVNFNLLRMNDLF